MPWGTCAAPPIAAKLPELLTFNRKFVTSYLKIALPVVFNEMIWSLGISVYNGIYAHISTEAIAAFNIATSIEALAFVLLIASSDAGGILASIQIGGGNDEMAYTYARRTLIMATLLGVLVGGTSWRYPVSIQISTR